MGSTRKFKKIKIKDSYITNTDKYIQNEIFVNQIHWYIRRIIAKSDLEMQVSILEN